MAIKEISTEEAIRKLTDEIYVYILNAIKSKQSFSIEVGGKDRSITVTKKTVKRIQA